ncbi:hypothetical protein E1B28_009063 [Marasmius oreades]|uniref:Uncharacterized protein n=1 Tax=Marasmius oreades TaxID=181124 RepID=A0A9P7UT05_9AGAR|nr:uncharacterized protein E1B28_009063 [Marasmius oreades]KAG7092735.1 hypothetical protein E1B28_009063 [Marasmius oreades]
MILRLTSSDMLNSSLVDISTGETIYTVITIGLASSDASSSTHSSSLSQTEYQLTTDTTIRKTRIYAGGSTESILLSEINWKGRRPDIKIGNEHIGTLANLFDTAHTKLLPKSLAIPTRFDSNHVWAATATSLTLLDYNTNQPKGTFRQNVLRSSTAFMNACIPGVGANYIEFTSHPAVQDVEIIVSFFLMDILRRGCFCPALTPYMFEDTRYKSPRSKFQETRELISRKLKSRRNTV